MKIFITKHVLTQGRILEKEAELCDKQNSSGTIFYVPDYLGTGLTYYKKPDWHRTLAEAKRWALKMVGDRLRLLESEQADLLELRETLSRAEQ